MKKPKRCQKKAFEITTDQGIINSHDIRRIFYNDSTRTISLIIDDSSLLFARFYQINNLNYKDAMEFINKIKKHTIKGRFEKRNFS